MSLIIDSAFASLEEAIKGTTAPPLVCAAQELVTVRYVSFDGLLHQGQIVVHARHANDVRQVFAGLLHLGFPVQKAVPVVAYGWDDDASMADNNCSGFNYRFIMGKDRLSNHSYGNAVDINPVQNPYIVDGKSYPPSATYVPGAPGTFTSCGEATKLFKDLGWTWGGDWTSPIDHHHFEKLY